MTLLSLSTVSHHFMRSRSLPPVKAVQDVSLCVFKGETLGLVGESGCGKSTLARIAVGLLPPSSGVVELEGQNIYAPSPTFKQSLPKQVQMVFQDPYASLNPRLKVGTSIGEALIYQGVGKQAREQAVQEILLLVGLEAAHATRYPHEFSGGQRQRLAIARALLLRPKLVVCDEPVSSLDASVQAQVLNLLKDLQDSLQLSYIFISHDLAVVSHMSDRVAVMYLGHLVELAPALALFSAPKHPYTQALLASLPNAGMKTSVAPLAGELPSPLFPPSGCVFHPRCPQFMPLCVRQKPSSIVCSLPSDSPAATHQAACHLYSHIEAQMV